MHNELARERGKKKIREKKSEEKPKRKAKEIKRSRRWNIRAIKNTELLGIKKKEGGDMPRDGRGKQIFLINKKRK